jgi:hypothetical protein
MKDLVIYKTQQPITGDPFETSSSLSLSLAQKEHINVTLDAQVVFFRDGELQRISIHELDDQIHIVLELSKRHHRSLIMIFGNIIGAALTYTRRGRVFPTPGELMRTLDPRHDSHVRMIYNDGG